MPKLIFSSETFGCGATIQLDNQEICAISVAQTGVLVRGYGPQFLSRLLGSFRGAILYNEKNIYKAAEAAAALAERFPNQEPILNFKNTVLASFANAVWNSSSAANAAVELNVTRP